MNIWIIQAGELSQLLKQGKKMRSVMLAYELASRGHEVLWWTSSFDHLSKSWITEIDDKIRLHENIYVQTLKGIGYKKNISLWRVIDHKLVALKFRSIAKKEKKPDCIVSSLPTIDLAYESYKYSIDATLPYIVDVRDPWPDAILDAIPKSYRHIVKPLMVNEFRKTKIIMSNTKNIVAASNTFLNWALSYASRDREYLDKVFYIGHEKKLADEYNIPAKFNNVWELIKNKFIVIYVGAITFPNHNPMILIDAAKQLSNHKDILFIIAGDGGLMDTVKESANGLHNVLLTGWLNQEEINFLLKWSSIGVCPSTIDSTLMTNKFFAYLNEGLPILSSYGGDIKEIIESNNVGFYYKSDDIVHFTQLLLKLKNDQNMYREMSKCCKVVYEELFNSTVIYKQYAKYIEDVISYV